MNKSHSAMDGMVVSNLRTFYASVSDYVLAEYVIPLTLGALVSHGFFTLVFFLARRGS